MADNRIPEYDDDQVSREIALVQKRYEIGQLFSPATPINEKDMFAGRGKQIKAVLDAISQRGLHAIVYGERGVGKTSLSNVLAGFFSGAKKAILAPRVTCHSADTFPELWNRIFREIKADDSVQTVGLIHSVNDGPTLSDIYGSVTITPDVVREALASISDRYILLLIIDEFDRLEEPISRRLFADTIKVLSDYAVNATVVLVGVADTVDGLIEEHESIQRNLVQVPMPRMSQNEMKQIIMDRLPKAGMTIDESALDKICVISRGLPHYVHLLGQHSAWAATENGESTIASFHVGLATKNAIRSSQETIQSTYHKATVSPRKDNLFAHVLLACALATSDEFGYFAASDVRVPLSKIKKRDYEIPAFARHLALFTEDSRGGILQAMGERYQRRYRFRTPLMQPYIIMRGIAANLISLDDLGSYQDGGDII